MWNIRTQHITTQTRGLTLVEMLMATALTLVMFAAVAQIFGMMGTAMRDARATIELSGNLRSVSTNLQHDLDNVSVDVLPWVQPGANQGYFEIIEGPDRDVDFAVSDVDLTTAGTQGSLAGDADDIICFTAYSRDQPFVGLIQGQLMPNVGGYANDIPHKYWVDRSNTSLFTTITSHYAEIVYFTKHTPLEDTDGDSQRDADETVTLYRRVLLIRPDIFMGNPNTMAATASYSLNYFQAMNYYDLSMWSASNVEWKTNSLEDLQSRDRRVAHAPYPANGLTVETGKILRVANPPATGDFDPAPMRPHALLSFEQLNRALELAGTNNRDRTGEDVMLTNTLAFDVRVYDPIAPVRNDSASSPSLMIAPGDPGFGSASTTNPMLGAFVDLNWSRSVPSGTTSYYNQSFEDAPNSKSLLRQVTAYFVDTNRNATDIYGSTAPANANEVNTIYFLQNPSMLNATPSSTIPGYSYYDTWPFFYEVDGVNQDASGTDTIPDEGTNGFDDDGDDIVDDHYAIDFDNNNIINTTTEPGELETEPPYNKALRAVSITVRAIEEGTRQVRQDTIISDFLPD
ncbi:hypothetical protein C5Y96_04235 [Blastopirellula marina]|uniref:Uncharacterized protein n=1 Tax=Blastopirellula marina TaxID=124 RepID=A0A2S8G3Q4_9BACT|nr:MULTISPECIES: hypothetical protein [Pirellulaceae]PQO39078.1 hypothetical protein C5Y96_04235 [Blastopirellula marina]RCS55386.1 hypothetical protein DTL36_04240 [Bremerella cremea]